MVTVQNTERYADQYLDLVTPANCALDEFMDAWHRTGSLNDDMKERWMLDAVAPAAEDLRDAKDTFAKDLLGSDWPEQIQPDIVDLASLTSEAVVALDALVATDDPDRMLAQMGETLNRLAAPGGSAIRVRFAVDLPANVTTNSEGCESRNEVSKHG